MKSIAVFCRRCLVHTALFENIRPLPFDFTTLGNDGNSLQQSVPEGNEALPVASVSGEKDAGVTPVILQPRHVLLPALHPQIHPL